MSDDLHTLFVDALSGQDRPAMGNLVETAINQGSRARRRRSAARAGGLVVTVAAVGALIVGSGALTGHPTAPRVAHAAADPTPSPSTQATVPATAQGMAQLLTDLLPAGSISYLAQGGDHIEAYLSQGAQTGMIRISLSDAPASVCDQPGGGVCAAHVGSTTRTAEASARAAQQQVQNGAHDVACTSADDCTVLTNGDAAFVTDNDGNCIQSQSVDVVHPDGTNVQFDLATCLQWNGTANPDSPQVMTAEQAIALASDPRWDLTMDASLVSQGAQNFPSMPYFS